MFLMAASLLRISPFLELFILFECEPKRFIDNVFLRAVDELSVKLELVDNRFIELDRDGFSILFQLR